jgi:hypothetical protein
MRVKLLIPVLFAIGLALGQARADTPTSQPAAKTVTAPVAAKTVTPTPTPDRVVATEKKEAPAPASQPAAAVESEVEQTWWQALLYDVIFKVFVPIFVPVLSVLVYWLLRRFGLKVELDRLDSIGAQAAEYAEHKAKVWLKENGKKSTGAQKEDWAWELVEAVDAKLKAKEKAKNKLRAIILSKIPGAEAGAGTSTNGAPVEPAVDPDATPTG